ncbi:hypothetical protein D9756_002504 [Leucocoprinus leucothites]|uniref:RRM domain-containing protein n=1 Tax=Leucocoprinus leucothites TaxID=201217 RepID=A0A8H5GCI8_9AGAR|nr:hypothetical protein D9756_002504 [Leucoagaricus leucothites]
MGEDYGKHSFSPTSRLFVSGRSWSIVDHRESLFLHRTQLFLPSPMSFLASTERGYREERHRSSRHDDRDRDGRGYRDRDHDRYNRRDDERRDRGDRYGRGNRGEEYGGGRHGPRHDDDRRHRRDDREGRGGGGGGGGGGREDRGVGVVVEAVLAKAKNVALLHPKALLHSLSESGRPQGGMFTLRAMNSIPLCKPNKRVCHSPNLTLLLLSVFYPGLFNLPGANRTQIPPILSIPGLPPPMPVQSFGMGIGGNPNLSRQSRRLYIGSITQEVNEQNLADFFNAKMAEMNIGTGASGNPVLAVQCNYEKNYAFVEFRSAEDATAAMAFDGIIFVNGPLKIRRPKDYGGDTISSPGVHVPGVVSTNVPDSINKIFVGGLPTYLNEEQVMELLKSFGELRAFNLVRENGTGASKGFAFFEYTDPTVTDVAIQSLNGMELGDRYLVVQRASVGAKPGTPGMIPNLPYDQFPEIPRPIMPAGKDTSSSDARILLMLNMVTIEDLVDDDEYGDLYEDVKDECSKYGALEDLRIPRPVKKDKSSNMSMQDAQRIDEAAGVGRVYVKYLDTMSASAALNALAGRSFAGRSIIATLLSDDSQTTPPLNIIFAPQPDAPPPLPSS